MKKPDRWRFLRSLFRPMFWKIWKDLDRRKQPVRWLPEFLDNHREFLARGGEVDQFFPILYDYSDQAGSAHGHYFHQDLLVARLIHEANPARHIDVGSRIDGFIAHVAAFRPVEIMDVRPLKETGHANISFLQADLMKEGHAPTEIADSVSCLHALEHFGLGRYTDPIMPDGHLRGFANLLRMLKPGGTLYVSFPIGRRAQVCFNAHRIFAPRDILSWPTGDCRIELTRFDYVDDQGNLHQDAGLEGEGPQLEYGCGIYSFKKIGPAA